MIKNIFIFFLVAILTLSTVTELKVSNIQIASDGGVILSARTGYAWDRYCEQPHYYVSTYNPFEILATITYLQPCRAYDG